MILLGCVATAIPVPAGRRLRYSIGPSLAAKGKPGLATGPSLADATAGDHPPARNPSATPRARSIRPPAPAARYPAGVSTRSIARAKARPSPAAPLSSHARRSGLRLHPRRQRHHMQPVMHLDLSDDRPHPRAARHRRARSVWSVALKSANRASLFPTAKPMMRRLCWVMALTASCSGCTTAVDENVCRPDGAAESQAYFQQCRMSNEQLQMLLSRSSPMPFTSPIP